MYSDFYDEDYINLFGDNKFTVVSSSWDVDCTHPNRVVYTNDEIASAGASNNLGGYCVDCGFTFEKGDNPSVVTIDCKHPTIQEDPNGTNICSVCFAEIEETLSFEPEWKCYENYSCGRFKDKSRCHRQRSNTSRGVSSFFEQRNIKIDKATLFRVETKYKAITKDDEGDQGRAGLIAAILFKDFRNSGNTRPSDHFKDLCRVTKKEMSAGITRYDRVFPNESRDYILPIDILPWLLGTYEIEAEHHPRIKKMVELLSNCDPIFKNKTPQAVASAIIYLYLCINPEYKRKLGMNKTKFAEKSSVSDITITKLINIIMTKTQGIKVEL